MSLNKITFFFGSSKSSSQPIFSKNSDSDLSRKFASSLATGNVNRFSYWIVVTGHGQVKACEAILQHTKQPEVVKGQLTIGIEQSDTINDLREITENLADTYRGMLENKGIRLKDVAEANIIDITPSESENE